MAAKIRPYIGATTLLAACITTTETANAEVDWASVVWQNDIVAGTDGGGYTNGLYLSIYDLSTEGEGYNQPLITKLLSWTLIEESEYRFSERALGQLMITPKDIEKAVPDKNDAPYAGLLYYRTGHAVVSPSAADMISVTLGLIGPDSGAESSQKLVHKITGSKDPQGWDYQLDNEFVFSFTRSRVWRKALHPKSDVVFLSSAQLGNLESSVFGGLAFRVGNGLEKDYATMLLNYGRMNNAGAFNGGWHAYAGATANYVFNYIFVDGNTYSDKEHSELRHQQFQLMAGFSYSWSNWSLTASFNSGSPLDKSESARHSFGTFAVAWKL